MTYKHFPYYSARIHGCVESPLRDMRCLGTSVLFLTTSIFANDLCLLYLLLTLSSLSSSSPSALLSSMCFSLRRSSLASKVLVHMHARHYYCIDLDNGRLLGHNTSAICRRRFFS